MALRSQNMDQVCWWAGTCKFWKVFSENSNFWSKQFNSLIPTLLSSFQLGCFTVTLSGHTYIRYMLDHLSHINVPRGESKKSFRQSSIHEGMIVVSLVIFCYCRRRREHVYSDIFCYSCCLFPLRRIAPRWK